jgi:hypothetical protein
MSDQGPEALAVQRAEVARFSEPAPQRAGIAPTGPCLAVIQGPPGPALLKVATAVEAALRSRFQRGIAVLAAVHQQGEARVMPPSLAASIPASAGAEPATLQGAIPGRSSVLGALLHEGVRREAAALALIASEPHDESMDWLSMLFSPILDGGFDYVCPAYRRHRTEAALNTGIVYPLTRALYGRDLRQPLGGEAAFGLPLARRLLADLDWRRDPLYAGSDAWLVAKVLSGETRVCQAWLGAWPRSEARPEELSQTLARALGLVFREMERHAEHWQRIRAPRSVPSFGPAGFAAGNPPRLSTAQYVKAFQLGLRELAPVWGLVLPPATLLALQRASSLPPADFRIDDALWARVVFDFAVAYMVRTIERSQLLRSLTPLYLGWLASFALQTAALDDGGAEARIQALCAAFEREKPYLIARWRWPDGFNP